MALIQDATSGRYARVDDDNNVRTFAISQTQDKQANIKGFYYSVSFTVTPVGANDYFFYFQNTGIFDMNITDIRVSSSATTKVEFIKVSGTPSYVGATAAAITNRNLGSSNAPNVIANYDTDITGLTNNGRIFFLSCNVANELYTLKTTSNIIVPQGQAFAMRRVGATGTIDCVLSLAREIDSNGS